MAWTTQMSQQHRHVWERSPLSPNLKSGGGVQTRLEVTLTESQDPFVRGATHRHSSRTGKDHPETSGHGEPTVVNQSDRNLFLMTCQGARLFESHES